MCHFLSSFITVFIIGLTLSSHQNPFPDPHTTFHQILREEWNYRVQHNPLLATSIGNHNYDHLLPSAKEEDFQEQNQFLKQILQRLKAIDRARLSVEDQVSYDIFLYETEDRIADFAFKAYLIPISADDGFHITFARLPRQVPLRTVQDYHNYIKRLIAFSDYMEQHIVLMKKGARSGITLPRIVLEGYETTITNHVVAQAEASVFYEPFQSFPVAMSATEKENLTQQGKKAIMEVVVPAYQRFAIFMKEEYIPHSRTTIAASELPQGKGYYAQRVRYFTTLDMNAEQVHQLGLSEVKRIKREMEKIIVQVGFKGSFADFLNFLRTDPQFYATTPEELLKEASFIAKTIDAKLPAYFGKLPRQPYGVQAVPASIAPKYTGGRYVEAPLESKEPGYYWVNTYKLKSRPLYVLTSLTLHEAVPGHHLQIALSKELSDLPEFRQNLYISTYGEGWGLYSEWLGLEMGLYTNPYSNFGRLTYEMWRACRLVVDTGIHAMGWTRQQAMDYMAAHTALSLHEVQTETDRYIAWPGQALSYKIGELKIKDLRKKAEEQLKEKFDIRKFHDEVLAHGAITLSVLEKNIDSYIAKSLLEKQNE